MTAIVATTEKVRRRRNRGRHELFLQILKAMDGGARYRTYVMYTCNLSWDQLKLYLGLLSKAGFIDDSQVEKSSGRTLYSVTDKGREFYKAIEETQKLLKETEKL